MLINKDSASNGNEECNTDNNEKRFLGILKELESTDYNWHEHEALFSADQEGAEELMFPGLNLKNLLIKDKKTEEFFMVVLEDHRRMDQKHFKQVAGWHKNRFATPEEMWELLRLKPGSVTPYALFNDTEKKVTVVLGNEIVTADDAEWINLHPCRNTATVSVHKSDFYRILEKLGNPVIEEKSIE